MANLDFKQLWEDALSYEKFVEESHENCAMWTGKYRTARIPEWAYQKACEYGPRISFLAIAEDWCGDASNTVPVLARMGHEAECMEMKILRRDEHPEVMSEYLTNGSKSIPIIIALDADFVERGHWGPRPQEIQAWVMENKDSMPDDQRYKHVRTWYARDKGETMLREVLGMFEG